MKLIPTSTNPVTITLYRNYPFDNTYKETGLFNTDFKYNNASVGADKNSFLEMKDNGSYIFPRTTKTGTYNFAFGNGLVTSLILELNGDEINTNYIKVECSVSHDVYYYFVTGIIQKNEVTYLLNLELDIFMTYGDKFLTIMQDKPVMTERKHCYRVTTSDTGVVGGNPRCSDLVKPDSNFSGVKANINESVTALTTKILDKNNVKLKNYNWCYVIIKVDTDNLSDILYKENDVLHSYAVLCFPLVTLKFYMNTGGANVLLATYNPETLMKFWATSEYTYKITILPYPPFNNLGTNEIYAQSDSELSLLIATNNITTIATNKYRVDINSNTQFLLWETASANPTLVLTKGLGGAIEFDDVSLFSGVGGAPAINNNRDLNEIKLHLPPFKEYKINTLAGEPITFNPQLRLKQSYSTASWKTFSPKTILSSNPDNTSFFTTMNVQSYDIENKLGLCTTYYYSMPTSYTALQHFLNTASAEYNNSKLINGISAIASVGLGGAMIGKGGMGALAGTGAVVSGVVKSIDNITSYYAKMEDLKNTPATLTTGGSTFTLDYAMAKSSSISMLPYVSVFSVEQSILRCASDFFYYYGYEVNRDCYFNLTLGGGHYSVATENSIFTRTLFNYVKLSEDITGKICDVGSGVPYTIAKKFSDVFMNGITMWTFFGFPTLQNKTNASGIYNVFNYFHKNSRENAEFYGQVYVEE